MEWAFRRWLLEALLRGDPDKLERGEEIGGSDFEWCDFPSDAGAFYPGLPGGRQMEPAAREESFPLFYLPEQSVLRCDRAADVLF